MTKKYSYETKKDILKSIEALAELDSTDFKKGVVDMLELLYEQDVSMTNVIAERVEKLEKGFDMLKGFVLGLHIASFKESINDDVLRKLAVLYEVNFQDVQQFLSSDMQVEDFTRMKKSFLFPKK